MTLSETQGEFTHKIAMLIIFAYEHGYTLTFGDAYRDPRVHGSWGEKKSYSAANSVHKKRLAVDFNIFRNGEYLQGDEANKAHGKLHDFWDSLGGAPGIDNDMNHYSVRYENYY